MVRKKLSVVIVAIALAAIALGTGYILLARTPSGPPSGAAATVLSTSAACGQAPVSLASAASFAVLAGSTVTNTGSTTVTGDIGVSPGTAATGFPPGTVVGTIHAGDAVAAQAELDLTTAYNDAAGRTLCPIAVAGNLGGLTLTPGLYKSTSSLAISSGDLTLDAQGDASAAFIFQMASTLTTTAGRQVILAGGAQVSNIFWQVGSSATLGTTSNFSGTIMADQSISLNTGATLAGRALARNGAVTLDTNTVTTLAPALLRVTTNPAVPGKIIVDGVPRDEWGLAWMKIAPGTHTVKFGGLNGFATPADQTITVSPGQTAVVQGNYVSLGFLRVITSPALPSTISVNGVPRDDWGMWTALAPGTYTVHFGAVAGYNPPADQSAVVLAGATTTITGTFLANPSAPGPDPTTFGYLRVTTTPATAAQILVNGVPRDDWGLAWVKLAPGMYTVSFGQSYGVTPPAPQTVTVTAMATTVYDGVFTVHGSLRIITFPALPATVFVNGIARDDWGMWQSMPPGTYTVSFGDVAGYTTPASQTAIVAANTLTSITGTYATATASPLVSGISALERSVGLASILAESAPSVDRVSTDVAARPVVPGVRLFA
jgi:hypothetical protein